MYVDSGLVGHGSGFFWHNDKECDLPLVLGSEQPISEKLPNKFASKQLEQPPWSVGLSMLKIHTWVRNSNY